MRCRPVIALLPLLSLAQPVLAQGTAAKVRYDVRDGYNLAFVDADVRRVADAILGSMLGVDYSVDPDVTGNITLRTTKPVAGESLVPMLEQALQTVDAVIVRQGASYRIASRKQARSRAPIAASMGTGGSDMPSGGYASEIVTLRYASSSEMTKLLGQFLGEEVVSGGNDAFNQVVITGTGSERQAARDIIARFDVDVLANMVYQIYRLENVDPGSMVAELKKIFQPPYDILGTRIRAVPLPRLKSIMLIAADRSDLARIEPWIQRLDVGISGKRKLYNYVVQNGRARDIAAALQQVLGGASSASSADSLSSDSAVADSQTTGASSSGTTAGANAGGAAASSSSFSSSPQSSASLSGSSFGAGASGGMQGGIRIVPNEQINSLLIYADGEEYELIREALQSLDRPVAQVLIEATLAEVTLNNDLRYGVDFNTISGNTSVTNVSNSSGVPASTFPGFSLSILGNSTQTILNALQSKTNVRVLSAPKLMVLNNQTATLQVGDQVPVITQQSQSVSAPGAPVVNSVDLRDTGVILKVTPRVNDSGTVTLDINQEVSDVAETTTSGINSPTIQQRRLSSTVATRSGQMVALGGLIRDRVARTRSGLPLLSQIPVVGSVFGRTTDTGSKTELIILLTPTVVRSPDEAKGIAADLINSLDTARPLVDRAMERQIGGHAPRP
jgi:general secretion pathway protein D